MKTIITCEHAGRRIPISFRHLFADHQQMLNSHAGFDAGALDLAYNLEPLSDYLCIHLYSRLLIDTNRSPDNPNRFSKFTRPLPDDIKDHIQRVYYDPYREEVFNVINRWIKKGDSVFHLSIHSFTPVLNGKTRPTDIGILYDPTHSKESLWAQHFKGFLLDPNVNLNIHLNRPYSGQSDGFTSFLRKTFKSEYMGIELEINQKYVNQYLEMDTKIKSLIHEALPACLLSFSGN